MEKSGYTYILTNKRHTVLYIGVTANLSRRMYDHKNPTKLCFTSKYNVTKLVYYEIFSSIGCAIIREKQIKGITRAKKNALISKLNPEWNDLAI